MSVTKYFNKKVRRTGIFLEGGDPEKRGERKEERGGWRIKRSGPITKELVEKSCSVEMRRQTQCGHSGRTKSSYGVSSRELGLLSFQVRSSKDHPSQGGVRVRDDDGQ